MSDQWSMLEAFARLATQGKRRTGYQVRYTNGRDPTWNTDPEFAGRYVSFEDGTEFIGGGRDGPILSIDDARFIAACDPQTILSLIEAARANTQHKREE